MQPLVLLLAGLEEETKEKEDLQEGKKASRGFDSEQPEVWVKAEKGLCPLGTGDRGSEACLQFHSHIWGLNTRLEWLYVIKTLKWNLTVCSLLNY